MCCIGSRFEKIQGFQLLILCFWSDRVNHITPLLKDSGSSWGLLALCSTESQTNWWEDLDLLTVVAHMVNLP